MENIKTQFHYYENEASSEEYINELIEGKVRPDSKKRILEQRSHKWYKLRGTRFTGSDGAVLRVGGKGMETATIKKIVWKLSTNPTPVLDNDNYYMMTGTKLEPIAKELYCKVNNTNALEIGFISKGEYFGCSPDGLVGTDGLLEIKCPAEHTYINYLLCKKDEDVVKEYEDQIQWNLFVSGRKWCDLFIYCGNEAGKGYFFCPYLSVRVYRDEEMIAKMLEGVEKGIAIYKQMLDKYDELKLTTDKIELDDEEKEDFVYESMDPDDIPFDL